MIDPKDWKILESLHEQKHGGSVALVLPTIRNRRYAAVVYNYMFGQKRIVLSDSQAAEHDNIVREMCTYSQPMMFAVLLGIAGSEDPLDFCSRLETPHNCDGPGKRIRLDTTQADHPEVRFKPPIARRGCSSDELGGEFGISPP